MTDPADLELVAAIVSGDQAAAARLDEHFRERIERLARRSGMGPEDAADVVQDALVDVFRQLHRFRGDSQLATRVFGIARGTIANYWRRRARRIQAAPFTSMASPCLAVESSAEDVAIIREALLRLPALERLVFMLHDREGWTLSEIGTRCGLRKSAVGERLARAREGFRQALLEGGNVSRVRRLKD